jgi:hypothetical protein
MVPRGRGADHLSIATQPPEPKMTATMSMSRSPLRMHGPARAEASLVMTPLRELALLPLIEDAPSEPEGDFSRCGWFDSSLELAAGLQVIEFIDALPVGLPFQLA